MAHVEGEDRRKLLDWDALEVGEQFDTFSYVLTQQMIDDFRKGVQDPEAAFPTISGKVDTVQYHVRYRDNGSVNARCCFQFYNPPIAGKRITVQSWIADKNATGLNSARYTCVPPASVRAVARRSAE